MNCKECQSEIKSPQLTEEYCTKCFFKNKNAAASRINDNPESIKENSNDRPNIGAVPDSNSNVGQPGGENQESQGTDSDSEGLESQSDAADRNNEQENRPAETENHRPSIRINAPQSGKIYCQSCIDRGYGLKEATRVWEENYPICEDCFEPLMNNIISTSDNDEQKLRELSKDLSDSKDKPILDAFYNALSYPEQLRFKRGDAVLNRREEIFNYHAPANINLSLEDLKNLNEQLSVILFQIKVKQETIELEIGKLKKDEREKQGLEGVKRSVTETRKKPSTIKVSEEQKLADALFKAKYPSPHKDCNCALCNEAASKRLAEMRTLAANTRQKEFEKKIS